MKYNVGDKVRIKSLDWYNENKDMNGNVFCGCEQIFNPCTALHCGQVLTIKHINCLGWYEVEEEAVFIKDGMIEGLVEEDVDLIPKFGEFSDNEPLDIPTMTTDFIKEHGFPCPNGYIFKDENGNVINATKIVLEKKKKEYPKTYEECCKVLQYGESLKIYPPSNADVPEYDVLGLFDLLETLRKLLICRDAYWKIAGEEMGLGKPWEPSGNEDYFVISRSCGEMYLYSSAGDSEPLEFPTKEMRDAFYENFKELIESCKELL